MSAVAHSAVTEVHPLEVALLRAQGEGLRPNLGRVLRFLGREVGDVLELQVLNAREGRIRVAKVAHADNFPMALALANEAEAMDCSGAFMIANHVDPAVATRAGCGQWITQLKGGSTSDRDIISWDGFFVDFDAIRPKDTSATEAQVALTATVATSVHDRIAKILGGADALGLGHSGNGRSHFTALESLRVSDAAPLVRGGLVAIKHGFETEGVDIDLAVSAAKQLVPCFGTPKRKGIAGVADRPHRRTAFVCAPKQRRLTLGEFRDLVDALRADLDAAGRAEVDKAMGIKTRPSSSSSPPPSSGERVSEESPFTRAKAVPIRDVLEWQGLLDSDNPVCPGCGLTGDSSVAVVGNGLKCSHNRCARNGYANGFRTTVDVVMEKCGVDHKEAVQMMAEHFGFEGFPSKRKKESPKTEASVATEDPSAEQQPSAEEPLRGLEHLSKVAIVGRERIVALAEQPVVWIWDFIATSGIVILIAASPGSGKTTLLLLLIVARANRGAPVKVLGRTVQPAPANRYIVVVENEHADQSASRMLRKSCRMLGIGEEALDTIILVARGNVRIGSDVWRDVERLTAQGLVSDIVLDTLARCAPAGSDPNAEQEQVEVFACIAAAIEKAPTPETRPTVWCAAHTRKCEGMPTLDDVSGSQQRTGQADVVVLMGAQRTGERVRSVKVAFGKVREKDAEDWPEPVEYTVTKNGVVMVDAGPADADRPLEERILARLALGPKTKNGLATELGRSKADVDDALTLLFEVRRIRTTQMTVRGRSFKAFELRPEVTT